MNYNQFKDYVAVKLPEHFPKDTYEISIRKVTKNNGMTMDGLCIFKKGCSASPTIYLERYYDKYKKGAVMADILVEIAGEYYYGMEQAPAFIPPEKSYYETVHDQIILRLVNYEKNAEILADCPYIRFHDLAITFRWLAYQDDIGISTALITYKDLERWGIHRSRLYKDACINTPKIFPSKISKLKDLVVEQGVELNNANTELYVVTNEQGINGATCILYDHLLQDIANIVGCDYYLLPSSIHEMMICPVNEQIDPKMLLSLVKEANYMVVTMGEVLSDNIYFYDKEQQVLSFIKQSEFIS